MKKTAVILATLMIGSPLAWAHEHGMNHPASEMKPMPSMQASSFIETKVIDGFDVTFHIMPAPQGKTAAGSHHLMVKVEKNQALVPLQATNSKVTFPDGTSASHMMMTMGDWQMASYTLKQTGEYNVMVLFKTSDGKKHFGGVSYSIQ